MSEIAGQTGRVAATAVVHESYSFACMRCGHGWEQSYAIEHHFDGDGNEVVLYMANGRTVPSPLRRPTCHNCDGHEVRIMRPGQVSSVQNSLHRSQRPVPQAEGVEGENAGAPRTEPEEPGKHHQWHLSDLLHPFQHRKAG
jgi:hypothetical protein